MVKPIIVGAHYGFRDWLAQRVTAVVMALYTVIFAISALMLPDASFENWRGLFSAGFMKFATFLFFTSLFYHAWIGVRDIFMDYIKPTGVRLVLHSVVVLLLVGYAGWVGQILWRL
jgi:succinate dehydrogenase / fumarate reductase membrane anchor subunit